MSTPSPDGRWHYLVVTNIKLPDGRKKTGNGPVVSDYPIATYQDVMAIQGVMADREPGGQVVITNVVLLSAPA
jgi:hypothetical protein